MVCRDFILPEPASYVFFYAIFNLRNLLYIIRHVSSNRFEAVCIYICYCVEAVYGFHSTLGFFSSFFRENTLGSCAVCGGSKKSR